MEIRPLHVRSAPPGARPAVPSEDRAPEATSGGSATPAAARQPASAAERVATPTDVSKLSAEAQAEPEAGRPRWNRLAAAVVATSVGLGVAVGAGAGFLAAAPVCDTSFVRVSREGICISPQLGAFGADLHTALRGAGGHALDAVRDLASNSNRMLRPEGSARPPAVSRDELRVVSWNIHAGRTQNVDGARRQMDPIVQALEDSPAEVYLLQEVTPWDARRLVEETGMTGYYTQQNQYRGLLMLVHPELEVLENHKVALNRDLPEGDLGAAVRSLKDTGVEETRLMQALRVRLPDGSTSLVWNTHLTSPNHAAAKRTEQVERILDFVEEHRQPQDVVVGGGDLNARRSSEALRRLRESGAVTEGAVIDWLVGSGLPAGFEVTADNLYEPSGTRISDHPMLRGEVPLASAS